jgi:tetratricopeptide (TPR) repeat protein
MPFDFDTLHIFIEKTNKAIDWIVEEIFRQKNWRSLLVLIDVALFLVFNPFQWPFPNLLTPFPQTLSYGWYRPAFWSLVSLIFIGAVIAAARTRRKPIETRDLKPGAIKGLLPFGYEDAEDFAHLQRSQNLKECLQAIGEDHWRFGVLSGESGAGKTSFLQAGLWPALEKRKARCVYVKFSDLDPFESVRRACRKRLPACEVAADDADFPSLLRAATTHDSSPVVLLFDQFEQFFVHHKRKSDRAMFVQALTQWFATMESLPVKLLICIRGDFLDRLTELHRAMKYSLGPTQDFRLERFEPDQATEVICFLAEKEGLEYDRKFISEMARQELADTEDGLISPVDVQVLARMVQRQTVQVGSAFNRSTFQKLGGVEGLLDRYLTSTLETRETQARRQTAVKVLLALTDLERNTRAGALTTESIRLRMGGGLTDAELKESITWLQRGDVRLISPSSENEVDKFELAHERMILALRRLADKQLNDAERAGQLLDRRTNEWLGNSRHSRYLFSWSELRLINKHKRFVTWGKERQAKEELIAATRRRFKLQYGAAGLALLLTIVGWIGWNSDAWQTFLIKRDLHSASENLNDNDVLFEIARALVYAGDSRFSLQAVRRISDDSDKVNALRTMAESYAKLGDKEKASSLLAEAIKTAERISDDYVRTRTYGAMRISEPSFKTAALVAIAQFIVELGDKEKAGPLLADAIRTAERITDDSLKAHTLSVITESYAKLGETMKDSLLLAEAIKTVERINGEFSKSAALLAITESYARLGETIKDSLLLAEAIKTAVRISDKSSNAYALGAIASSYARLGETMKDRSLLAEAIKTTERIGDETSKAAALVPIAESYAKLAESLNDRTLYDRIFGFIERLDTDNSRLIILNAILSSKFAVADVRKLRSLTSNYSSDAGKAKALARILTVCSHPELIDKKE